MVEVKSVSKKFVNKWALNKTSWSVREKRSLALLGPNGAGKSTTLKIITGLLKATSGQVLIDGIDVMEDPIAAKKRIGYLPENPPLYDELPVWDFLKFICGLKSIDLREHNTQMDQAIEKLGLQEVAFQPIRVLSKGFRQRVGIAQALIGDPSLLILDEPAAGLDPHQVFEFRNYIRDLKKDHIVILSSHILNEVEQICDDVVILNQGEIKAQGSLQDLLSQKPGSFSVKIHVLQSHPSVLTELRQKPHVKHADFRGQVLEMSLDEAAGPNLDDYLKVLIQSGAGVQQIEKNEPQLEDLFIEVTQ